MILCEFEHHVHISNRHIHMMLARLAMVGMLRFVKIGMIGGDGRGATTRWFRIEGRANIVVVVLI